MISKRIVLIVLRLTLGWTLIVGAGLYPNWPAERLMLQAPMPKLPSYEECQPRSFEVCFAEVLRQRTYLLSEQQEYMDNYPNRVMGHLGQGAGIWLIPFIIFAIFRLLRLGSGVSYPLCREK